MPDLPHGCDSWVIPEWAVEAKRPFKCPVCDGSGQVSRPPWVAGDQESWSSTGCSLYSCRACAGQGIVWGPEKEWWEEEC